MNSVEQYNECMYRLRHELDQIRQELGQFTRNTKYVAGLTTNELIAALTHRVWAAYYICSLVSALIDEVTLLLEGSKQYDLSDTTQVQLETRQQQSEEEK